MEKAYRRRGQTDTVTAIQFTGDFDAVEQFVGGDAEWRGNHGVVASRQGPLTFVHNDWLVRNNRGSFRVLPPHLFVDAYTSYQ